MRIKNSFLFLTFVCLFTLTSQACPDGQYKSCIGPACACLPKVAPPPSLPLPIPSPTNITCVQYFGHPDYIKAVLVLQDNMDELYRMNINDKNGCKNARDAISLQLATRFPALAIMTWDMGRCICEEIF